MTIQFSTTLRTNMASQIQSTVSTSGTMKVFTGAVPANCAAADPSGPLGTITLPSTFLTSSSGATALSGTWSVLATASGTAASFRIYDGSSVCHAQGSVGTSGADLNLSTTTITNNSTTISVTSFAVTMGNS